MNIIEKEQTITTYALEFDGYKSSSKLSLSETIKIQFPTIRFGDYNLCFRFNQSKTKCTGLKFGCQEPSINTIKKAIDQLKGIPMILKGVRNINDDRFIETEVLESSENYIVTKNKAYLKSNFKIDSNKEIYNILTIGSSDWSPESYRFNGNSVTTTLNKSSLLKKLKMIVEIYDFINAKLLEI